MDLTNGDAYSAITKWYSGKALVAITAYVLPILRLAEAQGFWPRGASRKVRAALNKQTVAQKFARANERPHGGMHTHKDGDTGLLDDVRDVRGARYYESKIKPDGFIRAMEFGIFEAAPRLCDLGPALVPFARNEAERKAITTARQWAADFAPVADLVARLDITRPKPVYTFKTLSAGVLANISAAIGIDIKSIREPEVRWDQVEMTIKGKKILMWIGTIIWPDGTRHNVSKFNVSKGGGNNQCQACGHAIKSNNWVPLIGDTKKSPVSLWVGRDCASNLFGCDVTDATEYKR